MVIDIGFIVLSILCPVCCLWAYRQGLKDNIRIDKGEDLKPIVKPHSKPKQNKQVDRISALLNNIDSYDGSKKGQKEIKQ